MSLHDIDCKIVERALDDLFAAGFTVDVNDGEDTVLFNSQDKPAIFAAMCSTCEDVLVVRKKMLNGMTGRKIGILHLIHGNEPGVIIADNSTSLEPYLLGAIELANQLTD